VVHVPRHFNARTCSVSHRRITDRVELAGLPVRQPVERVFWRFRRLVCCARQPVEQVSWRFGWLVCCARQPVEQVSWRFRWSVCYARQPAESGPLGAESGVGHRDLCLIMMIAREPDILPLPSCTSYTQKYFNDA
jgi:hypothetical protein